MLWVDESGAVPSRLVSALNRRGVEIVIAREAPQVIVEVAECRPNRKSAPAGISVVVVEPANQPRCEEMRATLTNYFPQVRCWQYQARGADGRPRLESLGADASAEQLHVKSANDRLRSVLIHAQPKTSIDDGPLVSEEELAMLLGDEPSVSDTGS